MTTLSPTTTTTAAHRQLAVRAYLANGGGSRGAQAAWEAVRATLPRRRATCWDEQVAANTGCRRSYRSPLGCEIGVGGGEYGQHSAKWPRTVRSLREASEIQAEILAWLENQACALV
jgi:hypothetical protein